MELITIQPKKTKSNNTRIKLSKFNSVVVTYQDFYLVLTCLVNASKNDKTGDMIQSYLISKDLLNADTVHFGSKCTTCPMITKCYVNKDKLSVRGALRRLTNNESTSYKDVSFNEALKHIERSDKGLRLGTYGDPSILPLSDIEMLVKAARFHTGYTHYWDSIPTQYSKFLMASCENEEQELFAKSLGYRAFRVLLKDQNQHKVNKGTIECLNVTHGLTCAKCKLCDGNNKGSKKSIYIHEH